MTVLGRRTLAGATLALALIGFTFFLARTVRKAGPASQVIVQAQRLARAAAVVREAGGVPTRELAVIEAVAATLTPDQIRRVVDSCSECRIYQDRATGLLARDDDDDDGDDDGVKQSAEPDSNFPVLIGAASLHGRNGITGKGITVAVIDSGFVNANGKGRDSRGSSRIKARCAAFTGHGAHIFGRIGRSTKGERGQFQGVAPDAGIVSVKAFDSNGASL